jgi:type II secretory pathway pseudopilin PulG
MTDPSRCRGRGARKSGLAGAHPSILALVPIFTRRAKVSNFLGFTLIEIVIAVSLVLLLLGLAVPSLNGVLANRRLHESLDRFNELVRQAHEHSLAERRPYLIVLDDRGASLQPAAFLKTEERKPTDAMPATRSETWKLELPAALMKKTPAEWIFWESGVCEPARISFAGPDGKWTVEYSPLRGLAEIIAYVPR